TSIGNSSFRGCLSLSGINIPKSVTKIGNSAFRECPSLASITVAKGNPAYDSREGCNALIETSTGTLIAGCQNTIIPTTVTAIGYAAFDGCVLLDAITIPESVTAISRKAFYNCPALKTVVCRIADPSLVATAPDAFKLPSHDYTERILHVPAGATTAYQVSNAWHPYFHTITEQ
ncbi:MAG: leucine-rich repeat domain-containing protein, partial [Muribaculaceae bacterium]|nr:leucine-rich repeat domain-containing protein [Muribaculaceae bacterium]